MTTGTLPPAAWQRLARNVEQAAQQLWSDGAASGYGRGWQSRYRTLTQTYETIFGLATTDASKAAAIYGVEFVPTMQAAHSAATSAVPTAAAQEAAAFTAYVGTSGTSQTALASIVSRGVENITHDWERLSGDVRAAIGDTVQKMVARGEGSTVMGRELGRVADLPRWRGDLIARTELRTVQDDVNLSSAQAKGITQYVWKAASDACVICQLMHGEIADNSLEVGRHPNCRCVLVPYIPQLNQPSLPKPGDHMDNAAKRELLPKRLQETLPANPSRDQLLGALAIRDNPKWRPSWTLGGGGGSGLPRMPLRPPVAA